MATLKRIKPGEWILIGIGVVGLVVYFIWYKGQQAGAQTADALTPASGTSNPNWPGGSSSDNGTLEAELAAILAAIQAGQAQVPAPKPVPKPVPQGKPPFKPKPCPKGSHWDPDHDKCVKDSSGGGGSDPDHDKGKGGGGDGGGDGSNVTMSPTGSGTLQKISGSGNQVPNNITPKPLPAPTNGPPGFLGPPVHPPSSAAASSGSNISHQDSNTAPVRTVTQHIHE